MNMTNLPIIGLTWCNIKYRSQKSKIVINKGPLTPKRAFLVFLLQQTKVEKSTFYYNYGSLEQCVTVLP